MGIIFGRFRKKTTTYEQLEKLDTQIKEIEEYGKSTEITQKKVAGRFMLVSVFVYFVTALIFYFYFCPPTVYERLPYIIPLIAAPLVIVSVKRVLTWWYKRKLRKNHNKLAMLKEQKKKMLNSVMETETYKNAKKLLEKFAPEEVIIKKSPQSSFISTNLDTSLALPSAGTVGMRYRGVQGTGGRASLGSVFERSQLSGNAMRGGKSVGNIPVVSTPLGPINSDNMALSVTSNLGVGTPRVPMARTIVPRDRSAFDKLVDYLVGDGPTNRYALICRQCSRHNGMALREEFEYLSFHCCYCHFFNPAKKQRPPAPKLGAFRNPSPSTVKGSDTSESEKNSGSDSDVGDVSQNTVEDLQNTSKEFSTSIEATLGSPEMEHADDGILLGNDGKTSCEGGDELPLEDTRKTSVVESLGEVEPMEISDQEKGSTESKKKD